MGKVTPEVLVDIAGKIPGEVKDNLWAAIKSGNPQKMAVGEMPPSFVQNLEYLKLFVYITYFPKLKWYYLWSGDAIPGVFTL